MIIIGEKINGAIPSIKAAIAGHDEALIVERTLAIDSMKATVEAFKADGMDDVKIIIGGAPVSEEAMKITGADEWAHSPQKTVQVCKDWAEAI